MEEQKKANASANPETIPPSADSPAPQSPPPDVPDAIGSTSRNASAPDEKRPGLAQQLGEAFREGVASTKPEYEKRADVKIPPPARKNRQKSDNAGAPDRISQEGKSAAAVIADTAASVLDSVVQLVKKTPAMTRKYTEAFREGAASVKTREGRERRQERPPSAKKNWLPAGGGAILDSVLQAGGSAAEIVRGAFTALKPGEDREVRHKICLHNKKNDNLYVEIGRETVNSWGGGSIETEKISALLDEFKKNEQEIENLQEQIAAVAAAREAEASRRQQKRPGGVDFAVAAESEPQEEEIGAGADAATAAEPEASPEKPEAESPASPPAPEETVAAESEPQEEGIGAGADAVMAAEPEASPEKPKKRSPAKGRRGGIAPSGSKRGRR